MSKIVLHFIGAYDEQMTLQDAFMHSADIFEKGKRFATYDRIVITTNDVDHTLSILHKNFKEAIQKAGGYILFLSVVSVDGKSYNDSNQILEKDIQTISMYRNGTLGWTLFSNALKKLGYEVEVNDNMYVTKVSIT